MRRQRQLTNTMVGSFESNNKVNATHKVKIALPRSGCNIKHNTGPVITINTGTIPFENDVKWGVFFLKQQQQQSPTKTS